MPCFSPLEAWRSHEKNPKTGKAIIIFGDSGRGRGYVPITVACGQCVGCRLEYSRQWAMRCLHEASIYEDNCFITLTFDDANLPSDGSLSVETFQLFMKRLRKKFEPRTVRFFHCGEYGETYGRPHYHAILFNLDFPDKEFYKMSGEHRIYTSEILSQLWPFGNSWIGSVTFESAAYVARYIMKKQSISEKSSDEAKQKYFEKYTKIVPETGEIVGTLKPEYTTMSRRPGIGKEWYNSFKFDAYPSDFITVNGVKMKPPKYYDRQYEIDDPQQLEIIKKARLKRAKQNSENNTRERLRVRERCKKAQIQTLKRNAE